MAEKTTVESKPPHRILVVDDEVGIREFITAMLSPVGYLVDSADDGNTAWDLLQHNRYDLLVTDNRMPTVTGIELIQKLHTARLALPVIMVTGAFPHEEFAKYPDLRPAAILLKPFSGVGLLSTVCKVLAETDVHAALSIG